MTGSPKDGGSALPARADTAGIRLPFPASGDRETLARTGAPDRHPAGFFRVLWLRGQDRESALEAESREHPDLAGINLEALGPDAAERLLPSLLDPAAPGRFPVLIVDRGSESLSWCRGLAGRFPGDHYHCLALAGAESREGSGSAEPPPNLDVLSLPLRGGELAAHLRHLARFASERARRVSAERTAAELGRRLNETQGKLKLTHVLEEAVERLQRLSTIDGLTNITNRARFEEMLDLEWGQAVGDSYPLSLILIDIDYFKRYNDSYGHQLGDACLQNVARALLAARESSHDLVARYGGEEFAVLLPGRNLPSALEVAERLRAAVEALGIPNVNSGVSPSITISSGVATAVPDLMSSAMSLVQRADRALYAAKRAGRNRIAPAE